jgi:hypothetical protein
VYRTSREEPELAGNDGRGSHESVMVKESQVPSEDMRVRREDVTRAKGVIRGSRKSLAFSKEWESGSAIERDNAWGGCER